MTFMLYRVSGGTLLNSCTLNKSKKFRKDCCVAMSGESLREAGKFAKNLGGFATAWVLGTVALWTFSCSPENGGEAVPGSQGPASHSSARLDAADQWAQVSRVEELVLRLDAQLSELAFAVRNLELPDERTRRQFAPLGLVIEDLAPGPAPIAAELASIGSRARIDPPAPLQREVFAPDLSLWRPLLESVDFFEHAKLQIKRGRFVPDSQPEEFEAQLVFSARARMASQPDDVRSARVAMRRTSKRLRGSCWARARMRSPATTPGSQACCWLSLPPFNNARPASATVERKGSGARQRPRDSSTTASSARPSSAPP